jgi:Uma2 family endonuclease
MSVATRRYSVAEYLELERASKIKHEYFDGRIWPLGEPPQESADVGHHDVIVRNIAQALTRGLRASRYRVTSPARVQDTCMHLHLSDVCVARDVCEPAPENIEVDPRAIVEVLSPSTENDDRGKKFENFQAIPSLREFLLICQDRPRVEHYTRHEGADEWTLKVITRLDTSIHFPSLDCDIPLAEIYAKVDFPAGPLGLHEDQDGEAR